jgi:hypothetical protein
MEDGETGVKASARSLRGQHRHTFDICEATLTTGHGYNRRGRAGTSEVVSARCSLL